MDAGEPADRPGCHLTCIDNFTKLAPETRRSPHPNVRKTLVHNVRGFVRQGRFRLMAKDADKALRELVAEGDGRPCMDFIYVDSDGSASDYLEQAVLAFPLLKPGGIMVFDDYTHSREHDQACPRPGIDAFVNAFAQQVKVLHVGWQLILMKRRLRLRLPSCNSEYFHEDLSRV